MGIILTLFHTLLFFTHFLLLYRLINFPSFLFNVILFVYVISIRIGFCIVILNKNLSYLRYFLYTLIILLVLCSC